ncbi:MAG: amidohydrolase family protein [Longimicrobiaceae bacterium]
MSLRYLGLCMIGLALATPRAGAQERPDTAQQQSWDVTQARGQTREISFSTSEGTWVSVDLSPDGRWIVFDLLGHIYRMPATGGEAQVLTQNSGVAVNFHPRYSPDGRQIVFVSDRKGQNNLWIMEADGTSPRAVFTDNNVRVVEPAWTPDGQYIVVRRELLGAPGRPGSSGIWMYHRDGGEGVELIGREVRGAEWTSVSPDGKHLYFHASTAADDPLSGAQQLRRFDFKTGEIIDITAGESMGAAAGRLSSGGGVSPEISPEGRWLAFARQIPDGTISFKGHRFGPRTALWLRDLQTGAERILMDPIETQVSSGSKGLGVLPRYRWAADGKSILISQGGKIRRLEVASGAVSTIPFTARVHRTLSEMAHASFRISDEPFQVQFMRWQTASPDGRRLAFQSVGRIWIMDLPSGTPRRLTRESFEPLEYAPAWSPDGRWIAFTSWDDTGRGHLWKIPTGGGTPQQMSRESGDFVHPVWSPDGRQIVVARGAGSTAHGRTMTHNAWFDLVRIPASGGAAQVVTTVASPSGTSISSGARRQILRPSFGPEGRLFFPRERKTRVEGREETVTDLVSMTLDGSDERVHLTLPYADEIVPSPDGAWVAFQEGDNVYVTPFAWNGTGDEPLRIDKRKGKFPVKQLSREGGLFPRWRGAGIVEFGSGNRYFTYQIASEKADTTAVRLTVPRDVPSGIVALTGARIITLDNRRVIERGTVVIRGSRIACVGECDTAGADRVIDASGKTVIPGFIDMHSHHFREHRGIRPKRDYEGGIYLAYGVTTNLDNSMWSQNVFPTAELIEAGEIIGPRAFSTGDPLYRGDASRQNELSSYDIAEQNVGRLASWGAVGIKQYQQPRRDQRQWVADAARKRGLMVTAEGGDLMYNLGMIMDGQTGWEHPFSYVPIYEDVAKFFGKAKAVYSPTLVVAGPGPWNIEYFFQENEVWKDPKQQRWLPWRMLVPHTRRRTLRPVTDYSYPLLAQGMADIIAEGGYGAIGSHGEHHGLAAQWEVWMAASALGPMGALEVASLHGAHFLGAGQDLGSLEAGKLADLLVLNSNPLDDIRNTADLQYVMKGGRLYQADTLNEVWPRSRPFGEFYWVDRDALRDDVRPVDYWDRNGNH